MLRKCVIALLVFCFGLCVYSYPLQQLDEENSLQLSSDWRELIRQWIAGDIGLKKSVSALLDVIKGEKSVQEVVDSIRDIFGATSAVGFGLINTVRYLGVNMFTVFLNKCIGKDKE